VLTALHHLCGGSVLQAHVAFAAKILSHIDKVVVMDFVEG
jgi:hypothetical protein